MTSLSIFDETFNFLSSVCMVWTRFLKMLSNRCIAVPKKSYPGPWDRGTATSQPSSHLVEQKLEEELEQCVPKQTSLPRQLQWTRGFCCASNSVLQGLIFCHHSSRNPISHSAHVDTNSHRRRMCLYLINSQWISGWIRQSLNWGH